MSEEKNPYLSMVRRMGGLEFTPQTPEAWAELAKVLRDRSKSQEHAARIVGRFLEPGAPTRCPTPGELAVVARSVPADPKIDRAELAPSCDECKPYNGLWRWNDERGGLQRCGCARGLKLRELDESREASRPALERRVSAAMTPAADVKTLAGGLD